MTFRNPATITQRNAINGMLQVSELTSPQIDAILQTLVGHTDREWSEIEAGIILSSLIAKGKVETIQWANDIIKRSTD